MTEAWGEHRGTVVMPPAIQARGIAALWFVVHSPASHAQNVTRVIGGLNTLLLAASLGVDPEADA